MTRKRSALIFLNGELRDPKAARVAARRTDALICADGGARHAVALGLRPDHLVGDMDSLPRSLPKTWVKTRRHVDLDQGRSDLEKTLDCARSLGIRAVRIAGVLGGALDHQLVNIAILEEAEGLDIEVIDDGSARLLGRGRHELALKKGERFSLLAVRRARLSVSGARYGLKNEVLMRGGRGLGNRAEGRVVMTIREGRVWFITSPRGWS